MKKSLKAALLSAFIFPGAGQLYLKRHLMAAIFIIVAGVSLFFMITSILDITSVIVAKIQTGEVSADMTSLLALVTEQTKVEGSLLNQSTTAIALTWIISILHAFVIGKSIEKTKA